VRSVRLLVCALVLGACGASTVKAATTSTNASGTGASISAASATSGGAASPTSATVAPKPKASGGGVPDLCTLVTQADVEAAVGAKVTNVGATGGGTASDCHYELGDIQVDVKWTENPLPLSEANKMKMQPVAVADISPDAWYQSTGNAVHIVFHNGDLTVQVVGGGYPLYGGSDAEAAKSLKVLTALGKVALAKG